MSVQTPRQLRLRRLFFSGFTAMDLAEPLVSFDAGADARTVSKFLTEKDFDVAGVRDGGLVCGYARREALTAGCCGDHLLPFDDCVLLPESAGVVAVVEGLALHRPCFITVLDRPAAIVTLADLEKPPMRMFLFGVITLVEMVMSGFLLHRYPGDSWQEHLSPARVEKAGALQSERERRGRRVELIDCLQFGDKGTILSHDEVFRSALGFQSRKEVRLAVKDWETLRNNLAHTQEIIPESWQRIVTITGRIGQSLERLEAITPGQ